MLILIILMAIGQESGEAIGLDLMTGEPMLPEQEGVWDNYCVKRQSLQLSTVGAETSQWRGSLLWRRLALCFSVLKSSLGEKLIVQSEIDTKSYITDLQQWLISL